MSTTVTGDVSHRAFFLEAITSGVTGEVTSHKHTIPVGDSGWRKRTTSGTTTGKQDRVISGTGSYTTGGTNLDLGTGGTVTDSSGATISFAEITYLEVYNASTSNALQVGGGASAPVASLMSGITDGILVRPGGRLVMEAFDADPAYAVTDSTADKIQLKGIGATVSASYIIAGRSA